MKNVVIIGSTGSIGTQALDIVRANPDRFRVTGLAVNSDTRLLSEQIKEFKPQFVSVENKTFECSNTTVLKNSVDLVKTAEADIILLAAVGAAGLKAAYEAVGRGVRIALANKETLVSAGSLIMKRAKEFLTEIIPVDSEHSAIFQCINGQNGNSLKKILLTASGGAFRDLKKEKLLTVKAGDALKHPVWNMGSKVTIDSATLMNKGLEIIEAMHLFNVKRDRIEVIVHPESIIHSMVEFQDNTVIAELSRPDMRLPIQYAFTYPEKIMSSVSPVKFSELKSLTFREPDTDKFPCLDIAYKCADSGGSAPLIMNAANEAAVQLFLKDEIGFYDIPELIYNALEKFPLNAPDDIDEIICIDRDVKEYILSLKH